MRSSIRSRKSSTSSGTLSNRSSCSLVRAVIWWIIDMASIALHQADVVAAEAVGDEGDRPAVGRPRREVVLLAMVGEVAQAGAVGVHEVDLIVAVAVGGESDPLAVGRP